MAAVPHIIHRPYKGVCSTSPTFLLRQVHEQIATFLQSEGNAGWEALHGQMLARAAPSQHDAYLTASTDATCVPPPEGVEKHPTHNRSHDMSHDMSHGASHGVSNDMPHGVSHGVSNDMSHGASHGV